MAVQAENTASRPSYVSVTVDFEDGFGHVLGSVQGLQTGADSAGKAEIGPGRTETATVASPEDF